MPGADAPEPVFHAPKPRRRAFGRAGCAPAPAPAPRRRKPRARRTAVGLAFAAIGLIAAPAGFVMLSGAVAQTEAEAEPSRISGAARVRDGDTIVVDGAPVRLAGLHCPERNAPGGAEAARALTTLVDARRVACDLTGERTHDRFVGACEAAGVDLAETLIRGGACARCERFDPRGRYLEAQSAAGAWTGETPGYCQDWF